MRYTLALALFLVACSVPGEQQARIDFERLHPHCRLDSITPGEGDSDDVYLHIAYTCGSNARAEAVWLYQRNGDGWKRSAPVSSSSNATSPRIEQPAETPPLHMGSGITAPVVVRRVAVRVPKGHSSTVRSAGLVVLEGIVTTNGDFQNIKIIKGADDSGAAYASEAVRQWKFRPAMKAGRPVAVIYHVATRVEVR